MEKQEEIGITRSLVHVSVGIEDFSDPKDFEEALSFVHIRCHKQ